MCCVGYPSNLKIVGYLDDRLLSGISGTVSGYLGPILDNIDGRTVLR
jgi:hypothetical protein